MADPQSPQFKMPDTAQMQALWQDIAQRSQDVLRDFAERQKDRPPGDAQPGHRHVAVRIAEQQDRLEEEQDGRPHGGRPAEDGQDQPADERLHAEQQERRQTDGQRE